MTKSFWRLIARARLRPTDRDGLTGLPNRRAIVSELGRLDQAQRPFALFYLDIDRFKDINDSFGHRAGDELLTKVAERLRACLRASDFVARLSGDEFAVVAHKVVQGATAEAIAQRIIEALRLPFDVAGEQISIGVSVGIVLPEHVRADVSDQMKFADLALHAAKQSGCNSYKVYEPRLKARAEEKRTIEKGLRDAIKCGRFQLRWQPIVDLANSKIVSLEALLRWEHPQQGIISPAAFMPVAEETGLIREIGEWVLFEACRQGAKWPNVRISVNLSPLQLANDRIVDVVASALAGARVSPGRLQLEITESALLQDAPEIKQRLIRLKALGVSLSMDDFGTGYSSLSYVANYPFDCIKIDRSFVAGISSSQSADPIIRAIVQLARALECDTVAEGIETADQAAYLKKCGADFGQGYFFSRPVRGEEISGLLSPAAAVSDRAAV